MSTMSKHHQVLTNGVGKCSVPMWQIGMPAGFCDRAAYGPMEPGQQRYGGFVPARGRWLPHYVPALACYVHGGPIGCCTMASPLNAETPSFCTACRSLRWLNLDGLQIRPPTTMIPEERP